MSTNNITLLSFATVIVIAALVLIYLFSNQAQITVPHITRLYDIQAFKDKFTHNIYSPFYAQNISLKRDKSQRLWGRSAYPGISFIYYALPKEYDAISTSEFQDKPLVLRYGKKEMTFADNLLEALSSKGTSWFFAEQTSYVIERRLFQGNSFKTNINIQFSNTRIEIDTTFKKIDWKLPSTEIQDSSDFYISVKLDGIEIDKSKLSGWEITYSMNTHWAKLEPGEYSLEITVINGKDRSYKRGGPSLIINNIRVGMRPNGIIVKVPDRRYKRFSRKNLTISYPALDSFRTRLIKLVKKNTRRFGRIYNPVIDPVVPIRLYREAERFETVKAAALVSNLPVSVKVPVSKDSILEFRYGCLPGMLPTESASLNVRLMDSAGTTELFSKKYTLNGINDNYWHVARVPLLGNGPIEALIEFSIEVKGDQLVSFLLGEPIIFSPSDRTEDTPPNIILISLDTLRADHLGTYGYSRDTSPTIDRIASEGVTFSRAYSQSGYTLPSHKSFLTGYYPLILNYLSNSYMPLSKKLPAGVPTIATYLKRSGYHNVAFTNSGYVSSIFGYYKDFDIYNENSKVLIEEKNRIIKPIGFDKAFEWIKNRKYSAPFFMFLHTYSIHAPYAAPPAYDNLFVHEKKSHLPVTISGELIKSFHAKMREPSWNINQNDLEAIISAYDRGIRWTDDEIGRLYELLSSTGLLENTILIITSDHGEEFAEHRKFQHNSMYEELLRVPLIIRYPKKFKAGTVIDDNVELIDLLPTILDFLKIRHEFPLHGRSLLPMMNGRGKNHAERPLFGSRQRIDIIKYKNHKLIINKSLKNTRFELYNLKNDPGERKNLINDPFFDPDLRRTLIRGILYYTAQNYPGLNILVDPDENPAVLDIKIKGIEPTSSYSFDKNEIFGFRNDRANVHIGRLDLSINILPALVSIEAQLPDSLLKIKLSATPEMSGVTSNFDKIKLGLIGDTSRSSPLTISRTSEIYRKARFHEGFEMIINSHAKAVLWYTHYGWEWRRSGQFETIEEELEEQLRNLGYIQ